MMIYILLINCFLIGSTISLPSDNHHPQSVVQHVSVSVSNSTEIRNKKVDVREPAAVQETVEEDDVAEERDDSNFRTSHAINFNGVPFPRESSGSKYLKPQIDSALGEMIGENIRNIIDSHHGDEEAELSLTATTPANVVNINDINLLEAGSETKHKSRIVTKKAENGKEYEYEYYYYYEDEGEDDNDEVVDEKEQKVKPDTRKKASNIDTKSNDIPKVLSEEEQPIYTRFPPRDNVAKATTQQVTTTENAITDNRKHHVKRPSLELVDSHSFNTNDKKSTTRNFESEASKSEAFEAISKSTIEYDEKLPVTKSPAIDTTTRDFIMHKSAMDLYAILANENLNSENEVIASESSTTTEVPEETSVATSKPTTTRTTTTERTTTTTTTTTAAPVEVKSPFSRNSLALRNRGRNNQVPHEHKQPASTTTTTHAPASESSSSSSSSGLGSFKPRGRFNKAPSSASRPRTTAAQKEETTEKKETEVETSQPKQIGRTRNRFNLKPAITRTTAEPSKETQKESAHDEAVVTAGRSSLVNRPRPTFASRGRVNSRITTSSASAATETTTTSQAATQEATQDQEQTQEETKPAVSPTQSRLNGRLGLTRRNPLLVRKQQEAKEAQEKHDEKQKELSDGGDSNKPSESGVNRLKNRPRITIAPSHDKPTSRPAQINRRVNPLLKNRLASTTAEPSTITDEKPVVEELEEEKEEAVTESEAKEENITEAPTPKPHGLAALRRKIILRQPGKLK